MASCAHTSSRLLFAVAFVTCATGCEAGFPWAGKSSAAQATPTPPDSVLAATCDATISGYVPPLIGDTNGGGATAGNANGNGNGNGNGIEQRATLLAGLGNKDERKRANAALSLLQDPTSAGPTILDAAITVEGTLGDFRALPWLEEIAVNAADTRSAPQTFAFGPRPRIAATAAIGRIIEQNRKSPPGCEPHSGSLEGIENGRRLGCGRTDDAGVGDDADGDTDAQGITPTDVGSAIQALQIAACVGEPTDLRSSAAEALGLTHNPGAVAFLNEFVANPGLDDPLQNLFAQTIAARSLTNITHNNHMVTLGLMPRVEQVLQQANSTHVTVSP